MKPIFEHYTAWKLYKILNILIIEQKDDEVCKELANPRGYD